MIFRINFTKIKYEYEIKMLYTDGLFFEEDLHIEAFPVSVVKGLLLNKIC